MGEKTTREIMEALAKPFAPEDLEWRLQKAFRQKMFGIAVPYVTNRAIQNRLDTVVGPENWYNQYQPWMRFTVKVRDKEDYKKWVDKEVVSQLCGISIYLPDQDRWICKWDGAEMTDIEPVKGGLSDSMKRCAVQWGIGRVLYELDKTIFVDIEEDRTGTLVIKESERAKLDREYLSLLKKLELTPMPPFGVRCELSHRLDPRDRPAGEKPKSVLPPAIPRRDSAPQTMGVTGLATPAPQQLFTPPGKQNDDYEFSIYAAKVEQGTNALNTHLVLVSRDGRRLNTFVRGSHPELIPGLKLAGTDLREMTTGATVYYLLRQYKIIEDKAA